MMKKIGENLSFNKLEILRNSCKLCLLVIGPYLFKLVLYYIIFYHEIFWLMTI